ncbi:MAG: alpha/beta hydrolase [Deltaproteobacteria bacterium]|nr:alpha/beta hydrolase [Deltaproteobacteria bacterium]
MTPPRRKSVTKRSGIPALDGLKQHYSVRNFRLGGTYSPGDESAFDSGGAGGVTLESLGAESLRVAYIAVGNPERDQDGKITNAVIISPYYSGDSTFMYYYWYDGQEGNDFAGGAVVGPGKLIDTDKYYVIFLDAVGLWGASKPSDGLGMKFPGYNYFDCVQANYRLLADQLNISRIKLSTGVSMGAIQSYIWAVLHPELVEAILPIGGLTETNSNTRWLFELMTAAIQSDPVWRETKGDYYHLPREKHPNHGVMFGWSILLYTGLSFDFRVGQPWTEACKEVFFWEPEGTEGQLLLPLARNYDANDLLLRNRVADHFSLTDHLHRIRAKTLILHVANDQWLRLSTAEKTCDKIKGAGLFSFEHELAHYAVFRAPNVLRECILPFLREIGMKP